MHERTWDSDEDEFQDRDYDVAALANSLSNAFRYSMYEDVDEVLRFENHKEMCAWGCISLWDTPPCGAHTTWIGNG